MAVFPFTVRATDSEGSYADRQFSITVRNSRVERFMFVDNNNAYTSPDGTAWTTRSGQGGTTCAYGNGFWLIMTFPANAGIGFPTTIRKSTDGINYTFAAGSTLVWQKADGTIINTSSFPGLLYVPSNAAPVKLKFWNGKFYFVAYGNHATNGSNTLQSALWSSPDGITWTESLIVSVSTATTTNLTSTVGSNINGSYLSDSDGALFIPNNANGGGASTNVMGWYTTDGVNFTAIKDTSKTGTQYAAALTRINGLYLAQSPNITTATSYQYSTDGLNWTSVTLPSFVGANPSPFFYMNGTIYSFTEQTAATSASSMITSTDGLNWTTTTMPYWTQVGSGISVYPIIIAKNGLIIIGGGVGNQNTSGVVRISVDGVNFNSVAYGGPINTAVNDCAAIS